MWADGGLGAHVGEGGGEDIGSIAWGGDMMALVCTSLSRHFPFNHGQTLTTPPPPLSSSRPAAAHCCILRQGNQPLHPTVLSFYATPELPPTPAFQAGRCASSSATSRPSTPTPSPRRCSTLYAAPAPAPPRGWWRRHSSPCPTWPRARWWRGRRCWRGCWARWRAA